MSVWEVKRLFEDLPSDTLYDAKDSSGKPLHGLHVLTLRNQPTRYAGVYHVPTPVIAAEGNKYRFSIHLATSNDLKIWHHERQLIENADMPYVYRVCPAGLSCGPTSPTSWIVIVHEQWAGRGPGSNSPCQLGFKLYYTDRDFLSGAHFYEWTAPISLSSKELEGTPNIYWGALNQRKDRWSLDAVVGFHFNDDDGRDVAAQEYLTQLGDPSISGPDWQPATATDYTQAITGQGAHGHVGQRDSNVGQMGAGVLATGRYSLQEGNLCAVPCADETLFRAWRLWLYQWGLSDPIHWPAGRGTFFPVHPRTREGSFAFGNPSFQILPAPSSIGSCVLVSYMLFHEGHAPGDSSGALLYSLPL